MLKSQTVFTWFMTNDDDIFIENLCKYLTSNLEVGNNTSKI